MRKLLMVAVVLVASQSLIGCAARREAARAKLLPADAVCVIVEGVNGPGAPFLKRKIAAYLTEQGFHLAETGCDATVTYTSFNHGQWEMLDKSLFGSKSTNNWRTEGVVALKQGNKTLVEDERVDLRDYKTMQDLLNELAWKIVRVVPRYLRPVEPQKS